MSEFYYHVTHAFQSESTLYSCLNSKERLAWNSGNTWSLIGSNGIQTHNHLVCKQTLNHLAKLAKWLGCVVWVLICTVHLGIYYYYITYSFQSEYTLYGSMNIKELLTQHLKFKWQQQEMNPQPLSS